MIVSIGQCEKESIDKTVLEYREKSDTLLEFISSTTMVEFAEKAKQILERIRGYVADQDGWKQAKKTVSNVLNILIL